MPWIDSVVTHTTIRSVWGNTIRDHVVHVFASKAERDNTAVPVDGMCCTTLDTGVVYLRRAGTWHVLEMPWRSFTPRAWGNLPASGVEVGIVQSTYARWRQDAGVARVQAFYTADFAPFVNIDARVQVFSPVPVLNPGPTGGALILVNATGLASGGWSDWEDNSFLGGGVVGSRVSIKNTGANVLPFTTAKVIAGNTYIFAELNLAYQCDPTFDP